jgi:hypothetical protein
LGVAASGIDGLAYLAHGEGDALLELDLPVRPEMMRDLSSGHDLVESKYEERE